MSESEKTFTITLPKLDSTDQKKCTGKTLRFFNKGTCTLEDRTNILKTELNRIDDELKIGKDNVIPECITLGLITVTFYNEDGSVVVIDAGTDITAYFTKKKTDKKDVVHTVTRIELNGDLSKIKPDLNELASSIPELHKWLLPFIILRSVPGYSQTVFRLLNGDKVECNSKMLERNRIYELDLDTNTVQNVTAAVADQIRLPIQQQLLKRKVYYVTFMTTPKKIIGVDVLNSGDILKIEYTEGDNTKKLDIETNKGPTRQSGLVQRDIKYFSDKPYASYGSDPHLYNIQSFMTRHDPGKLLSETALNERIQNVKDKLVGSYIDMDIWNDYNVLPYELRGGGKIIHKSKKMRTTKKHYKKSNSSSKRRRYHRSKRVSQRR